MGKRVLVCGGRAYSDEATVFRVLDHLRETTGVEVVIHGAANGADALAATWAQSRGVIDIGYPAEWELYGKKAGPMRNATMLEAGHPDVVVAFPGGRGTADMVRRARKAGVRVMEVDAVARGTCGVCDGKGHEWVVEPCMCGCGKDEEYHTPCRACYGTGEARHVEG